MVTIDRRTLARAGMFAALIGVEVWLGTGMATAPSIRGYVETKTYAVSTPAHAIVRKLDVALGQPVTQGQVIAELDPGSIENDLAVKLAERKRILAARAAALAGSGSGSGEVADDALRVVDIELEALAARREALLLKAPADGVVESIDARPGDAVGAASPVATIVSSDTRHVVACIPEARVDDVAIGTTATVRAAVGAREIAGAVESLTPAVAPLPERCQSALVKQAQLGRVAVLALDEPAAALPGQTTLIAFGTARRQAGSAAPPPAAFAPSLIDLPPEILAASRFEASGLVWVAALDRYVVISDDTGLASDRKPPWLFTMSRRGAVDPEPITIENVAELDDVESIAAGERGALWLAASQSVSDKGNRPRAREVIARLVPTATGYKLDAKVHLASLLAEAPAATRAALGVPDLAALDIEGMAYAGGALYFGLKAPVDGEGRALIWKAAAPDRLLAGDLAGAQLAIVARVKLAAEVDGREVPGGIADLLVIDERHLLIAATASGISAKHQSGALYTVIDGTAARVRVFPELRPEGLALAPTPHRLAVVFDRGRDAPMWTELELPSFGIDL